MSKELNINYMTKAGVIAASYVLLTVFQSLIFPTFFAFGPIQLRIAEGLTLLPLVDAAAVPGLFIGCLLTNLILAAFSQYGMIDIICGSMVTLIAAILTSKAPNKYVGAIPPIALNAIIVSIWVSYFAGISYPLTVLTLGGGEALSVVIFGFVILSAHKRAKKI